MFKIDRAHVARDGKTIEISLYSLDNSRKKILKFERFNARSAKLETVELCDFDAVKSRYDTQLPSRHEYFEGIKEVNMAIKPIRAMLDSMVKSWEESTVYFEIFKPS